MDFSLWGILIEVHSPRGGGSWDTWAGADLEISKKGFFLLLWLAAWSLPTMHTHFLLFSWQKGGSSEL